MKLQGISSEGIKRLARKVKAQEGFESLTIDWSQGQDENGDQFGYITDGEGGYFFTWGSLEAMIDSLEEDEMDRPSFPIGLAADYLAESISNAPSSLKQRLARKVKGQDVTQQIVQYLSEKGEMSGQDIVNDLGVDEVDVDMAAQQGAIVQVQPLSGGGGTWYKAASRRRAQEKGTGGSDYWATVKSIAQEVKDELKEYGGDAQDHIWEQVDGNAYIIYYAKNLEVLQNSPNSDAIDDVGAEIDTSKGWQNILTQVAFYAMLTDVQEWYSMLTEEDDEEDF